MPKTNKSGSSKKEYVFAVGRRRSAIARVRLFKGKGDSVVNTKPVDAYFPGKVNKVLWDRPFKLTEAAGKYYVSVKVSGGGKDGQLEAALLGIAKSLAKENKEKFRAPLKKAGLLTRDARIRERRKVGMGGKARRKKQSPKR